MPDAVLFLKAMAVAAGASAIVVLALGLVRRPASAARMNLASVLGIGLGLVVGFHVLDLRPDWPPAGGLDRFLTIVFPAAFGIELIAGWQRMPRWPIWLLRLALAGSAGRILLHGSGYLAGGAGGWTAAQTWIVLGSSAITLAVVWSLLARLSDRTSGTSIPLALAEASLSGGIAVMVAGYVTGGEATLPLAAALVGAALAAFLLMARPAMPGAIGIGIVGLFGLLFLGRFFGGLSTPRALALFCAPLLCWVSELPQLCGRKPWMIAGARLALVAIPLVVVLVLAKRDFDRDTAPLLGARVVTPLDSKGELLHDRWQDNFADHLDAPRQVAHAAQSQLRFR